MFVKQKDILGMGILFIIMHSYKLGSDNNANQNVKDLYANPGRFKKISVEEPDMEAFHLPHLVYAIRKFWRYKRPS
jgi:hypothetical protein